MGKADLNLFGDAGASRSAGSDIHALNFTTYSLGRHLIRDVLFCLLSEVPVTNRAAQ